MSRPPFAVHDLGEIAIRCADIGAMFAFYRDVIGLEPLTEPDAGIAFLRIGQVHAGHTKMLALFPTDTGDRGGVAPPEPGARSSLHHLALNVDAGAQVAAVDWFRGHGLDPRVQMFGWIGWRGVFVHDPEGNAVELVAYHPSFRAAP